MKLFKKTISKSLAILITFSIILTYLSPLVYALDERNDKAGVETGVVESKEGMVKEPEKEEKSSEEGNFTKDNKKKEEPKQDSKRDESSKEDAKKDNAKKEEKKDSNKEENSEDKKEDSDELDLGEEKVLDPVGNPEESKTFTVTKRPLGSTEDGELVGKYDTLFDAMGNVKQNDLGNEYVVTLNSDYVIPAGENVWDRNYANILLRSANNKKYTLKRLGTRLIFYVSKDCKFRTENIILDGNNDGELTFLSENGVLTFGRGTIVQNFIDVPLADGPAIFMYSGSTLNIEEGTVIQNNNSNSQGGIIQGRHGATINISGGTFSNNKSNTSDGGFLAAYGNLNITGGIFKGNVAKKTGGAIIVGSRATAKIENASFENNHASTGGAIYSSSPLTIINSTFEKNEANWGGAIFTSKKLELEDCNFTGNKSGSQGGAIYINSGEAKIEKSTFLGNISQSGGGGIFVNHNNDHPVSITNTSFTENASYGFGGGIYLGVNSSLDVKNSEFSKNEAAYGAGISTAGKIGNSKNSSMNVENTSFSQNESLMGAGIYTSFPTTVNTCTFTKNIAQVHPQDEQSNPHLSGVGGAMEIADSKTEIKNSRFESNSAFGSGGAIGINGVIRDENNNIKEIKPNIKLEISENSKFIGNTCEVGQGGAIYTNPYQYEDPIDDENAYKNLTIDKTTIFNDNIAKAGLYDPPSNYEEFTNLKFHPDSDVKHKSLEVSSLLNNYDINYKNGKYLIIYDANGGKFADGTSVKQKRHSKDKQITIMSAPTREGYKFLYWKGSKYYPGETYKVTEDHSFTAKWNKIPELEVKDAVIEKGQSIDLRSLITKAADKEDGENLKDKVKIDQAGFDSNTPGVYKIKYTLTDKNGASVEKIATITVKEKKKPDNPPIIIPDYTPDKPSEEKPEDKPLIIPEENTPPILEVKDTEINVGEKLDLKSLIIKASDKEDGDNLIDKVVIEKGNFDCNVPGIYKIQYSLTDSMGVKISKTATIKVLSKIKKLVETNPKKSPKTGVEASFAVYSSLLALSTGVYYSLRKK